MQPTRAIIFDIDGTLSPKVSWTNLTHDLGAPAKEHQRIFTSMLQGQTSYKDAKAELLALWQATGRATRQHIRQIFETWPLHPAAAEIVGQLRAHYNTCLITGSMDLYAEVVATKLGIATWYANTQLVWDASDKLVDFHYHQDQASLKIEHFTHFCQANNIAPEQCIAVGDSENDIGIFDACSKGILIAESDPPEQLATHAWKTIQTLDQLPALLSK